MKKTLFLLLGLSFLISSYSQAYSPRQFRAGGGLIYATDINNIGLMLNAVKEFTNEIEGVFSYTYIFKTDNAKWDIIDLDCHYNVYHIEHDFNVYALAGLSATLADVKVYQIDPGSGDINESNKLETYFGFNIGFGVNYKLTKKINIAPEMKLTIIDGSFLRLGFTVQKIF